MCKHNDDDNVSPYLRRRLRSYDEAVPEKTAKATGETGIDRNVSDKAFDVSDSGHCRDGET